jgi:uncharacterized protein involved in outer membrane biogenesis
VVCRLRASALLAGRVEIGSIVVDGASLAIERAADGTLRFAGPLAPLLGGAQGGANPSAPRGPTLSDLPAVTATNASISFVDRAARGDPTLRLTDVRLTVGEATPTGVPISLAAKFDPAGTISGKATVRSAAAASGAAPDGTIAVTATATGLDAQTLLSYLAAVGPGGDLVRADGTLDGSLTLSGSRAQGLTGEATITQSSGSVLWDQIDLTAPFSFSTRLTASRRGGIALSDGQLTIAQLAAGRISATAIGAAFDYGGDTLRLTSAHASAYGGTWTQSGTVAMNDIPLFEVTLQADEVDCEALLTAVTGARPDYGCERLTAHAAVRGAWTGAETVAQRAEGTGHIELRGGTIPASSIIGAIWEALIPLVPVGRRGGEAVRDPAAATHVDRLTESFALSGGRMHTDDLSLVTDDYMLSGTGIIDLDGRLDLDTEIAMTPAGVTKLFIMAALPMPGDPGRLPPIPTAITGTLSDPDVRPQVFDLPLGAVATLFRGARSAGQALGEAAGDGLRALRRGFEDRW